MDNDIKAYDTYRNRFFGEKGLPENVRHELNIDSLCEKLDFTSSCIGRQYLYHIVCKDEISEIRDNESLIKKLLDDIPLRKQLVGLLRKLNKPDAYAITELLHGRHTDYSQSYITTINICRWLPLIFLLSAFISNMPGQFFILFLASYIVNCYLHLKQKSQLSSYYFSVPQLYILIQTAKKVAEFSIFSDTDRNIHQYINSLKELTKRLRMFRASINLDSNAAMPLFMFTELLDIFFLHTATNVINSFSLIESRQKEIDGVFRFIGFLDVMCSLSFLREEVPYYCHPARPENGEKLSAKSVYHPLIADCIPNDISISTKSILITGSNMSGKTSFIRTIAINAITGKTLNTCFAHEFRIDTSRRILSVINTEDDLENGKSYFLTETENVKKVLDCAVSGNHLLIFDELFKGTNTAERISINAAVLKEMAGHNNIVLASTHDNELTSLLYKEYELYHFCEDIKNETLSFDYKIKKGAANEGNAIKILKLYGYPDYITKEAEKIRNCSTFTGWQENK